MHELREVAPAFVAMAHEIVWASVATVDGRGRPRSRVLHPLWDWDDAAGELRGVIATGPTPVKKADLDRTPFVSVSYWTTSHDTCSADCEVSWSFDDATRIDVWERFKSAPAPVGYDPAIVPAWADGPTSAAFAVLHLRPYRLRVFPGTVLLGGAGTVLSWKGA